MTIYIINDVKYLQENINILLKIIIYTLQDFYWDDYDSFYNNPWSYFILALVFSLIL